jgi:hypothetical protein
VRGGNRLCDESALRRAIFKKYHSDEVRLRRSHGRRMSLRRWPRLI